MSDLKIAIRGRNDHNDILERDYPVLNDSMTSLRSTGGASASANVRIVFEPSAVRMLFQHISWGSRYCRGDVEQAGILLGRYHRGKSVQDEIIWGDVMAVVPAESSLVRASFETIEITARAWGKMYEDAAMFLDSGMQVLGWYHTHLEQISTRFSALDRSTQKKAFTYPYSFGAVFNPNLKRWSVFYGPDSNECRGELLLSEALRAELASADRSPRIMIKQVNGDSQLQDDGTVVHLDEDGNPLQEEYDNVNDSCEDDENEKTFGGLFTQFVSDVGQLLTRKPKHREYTRPNPVKRGEGSSTNRILAPQRGVAENIIGSSSRTGAEDGSVSFTVIVQGEERTISPAAPSRDSGMDPADRNVQREKPPTGLGSASSSAERKSGARRITIQRNENAVPDVRCRYHKFMVDGAKNRVEALWDYQCFIRDEDKKILQKQAESQDGAKFVMWGKLTGNGKTCRGKLELALEEEANTKIIFSNNENYADIIAVGIYESKEGRIQFAAIIHQARAESLNIDIVDFG